MSTEHSPINPVNLFANRVSALERVIEEREELRTRVGFDRVAHSAPPAGQGEVWSLRDSIEHHTQAFLRPRLAESRAALELIEQAQEYRTRIDTYERDIRQATTMSNHGQLTPGEYWSRVGTLRSDKAWYEQNTLAQNPYLRAGISILDRYDDRPRRPVVRGAKHTPRLTLYEREIIQGALPAQPERPRLSQITYTMSDGHVITGRSAQLLHMLNEAGEDGLTTSELQLNIFRKVDQPVRPNVSMLLTTALRMIKQNPSPFIRLERITPPDRRRGAQTRARLVHVDQDIYVPAHDEDNPELVLTTDMLTRVADDIVGVDRNNPNLAALSGLFTDDNAGALGNWRNNPQRMEELQKYIWRIEEFFESVDYTARMELIRTRMPSVYAALEYLHQQYESENALPEFKSQNSG